MPGIPGATHQEWGQPGRGMLGTPHSPHGRKGHGHRAGSRVSRRRPTTCDREKAAFQSFFLPSAGLARLCPTSHPMESWKQGAFMGVHTWRGVAHVERCTRVCAHAWMCTHVCVHVVYMLQGCACLSVCAWAYKGVCKFRCGGRFVGVLARGCAQVRCTCTEVCQCCVHMGPHVCAHMHLGGACIWVCVGTCACPGKCRQ